MNAYLQRLASDSPVPGGGSAATLVAASGAALVAMVARICLQSKRYIEQHDLARSLVERADALREACLSARQHDEAAFMRVIDAQAIPREARGERLEHALRDAAEAPLHAAHVALEIERLATRLFEIPNRNLVSDIGCAAEFAHAAVMACGYNVRINHRFMRDTTAITRQAEAIERYERESTALLHQIRAMIRG